MESVGLQRVGVVQRLPLLVVNFVAGALVLLFSGFFTGGIAGALAGKASDRGIASASYQSYCFVTLANLRRDVHGGAETRGLPRDVLKKLPSRVILKDTKAARGCCCTICLQDVEEGEIARTLPLCQHTFHLACVDKWLSIHGSCPLCRRDL
ncbi:NEP1-interacting protein-like 2 [Pyrus ussuriensis x Pyrus communis]|uniref:NEP1-interacting protein-like 2 n=1 Tax=Pyrus ussuriensis x Pyrus communis TaxID=2448454 RepID=A0A5N5I1D2_9ROSA|nr:NEP1-interacting protein-like 2 [Pyrus ussuriensis x Pyrus communis]